jgi:hypothetical protein
MIEKPDHIFTHFVERCTACGPARNLLGGFHALAILHDFAVSFGNNRAESDPPDGVISLLHRVAAFRPRQENLWRVSNEQKGTAAAEGRTWIAKFRRVRARRG